MKEFKDKVLVVTGGSRGIGKAIAVEGAKRGMKIVLNDIDGDQLAKTCAEIKDMGVECISQHVGMMMLLGEVAVYRSLGKSIIRMLQAIGLQFRILQRMGSRRAIPIP